MPYDDVCCDRRHINKLKWTELIILSLAQFNAFMVGTSVEKTLLLTQWQSLVCLRRSSYCWCRASYWLHLPHQVSYVSEGVYSCCVCFFKQTNSESTCIMTHVGACMCLHWCTITRTCALCCSVSDEPWSGSLGSSAGAVWTLWFEENLITD